MDECEADNNDMELKKKKEKHRIVITYFVLKLYHGSSEKKSKTPASKDFLRHAVYFVKFIFIYLYFRKTAKIQCYVLVLWHQS